MRVVCRFESGVAKIIDADAAARAESRALLSEMRSAAQLLRDATAQLTAVLSVVQASAEEQRAAAQVCMCVCVSVCLAIWM